MNNKPESKIGRRDFLRAGTVIAGAAAIGDLSSVSASNLEKDMNEEIATQPAVMAQADKLSVLFVAKFKVGVYQSLNKEERALAEAAAVALFGEEEDGKSVEPTAGIEYDYVDGFRLTQPGDRDFGWVAIVSGATYHKMLEAIQWPLSPFCRMYDIEITPLSGTHPNTQAVYRDMTPSHWM